MAAANPHGRTVKGYTEALPTSFPAPLILPGDDLANDPDYPPQSLRSWVRLKERNEVTRRKKTIYVAAPPDIDPEVDFIRTWTGSHDPLISGQKQASIFGSSRPRTKHQKTPGFRGSASVFEQVISYLSAFFTPLPVQLLQTELRFTSWNNSSTANDDITYIGLATPKETIGIRTRPCPDAPFSHQLNLNDLLDVTIDALPSDAYALIMLTDFDIYEDEDDDFCCGRAYGGSRVAIVSSARYDPNLDEDQGIDQSHTWPASHCAAYISSMCSTKPPRQRGNAHPKTKTSSSTPSDDHTTIPHPTLTSPVSLAISAFTQPIDASQSSTFSLHLFRLLRTTTHELLHCFGLDHCIYYACAMQSTASMAEDMRQPPYLCPVCVAKLNRATGEAGEVERLKGMAEVCLRIVGDGKDVDRSWWAWIAWLRGRIDELERGNHGADGGDGSVRHHEETKEVIVID